MNFFIRSVNYLTLLNRFLNDAAGRERTSIHLEMSAKVPAAFLGLISLVLLLSGCDGSLPDQVVPGDVLSFAKESLNLVVARDTDRVVARLDPGIDTQRARQAIEELY